MIKEKVHIGSLVSVNFKLQFKEVFEAAYYLNAVLQADDYYPFGLTFNSYKREFSKKNKMNTFQDQEFDEETGWVQFKWRNHMPELGRFFNVDPLAEDYYYNSPYAFSENKVTNHIELEGLEAYSAQAAFNQGKRDLEKQYNYVVNNIENGINSMGKGLQSLGNTINGGLKAADKFLNSFAVHEPAPSPEKSDLYGLALLGSYAGNGPAIEGTATGEVDVSLLQDAWGFGPPPGVPANTADIVKTAASEAVNVVTNVNNLIKEVTVPVVPDEVNRGNLIIYRISADKQDTVYTQVSPGGSLTENDEIENIEY